VELGKLVESAADRPFILLLLKEALFGEDLESCYCAIYQLGQMKGRDVAEVLESYLKANRDKDQAHNVAGALGVLHDPGSIPVLVDALQSKNPQTRLSSAEALLGMGYSAPAEDLITSMARQYESPDGGVRKKAIETIRQFNLDAVVPVLTLGLKDSDSDVRMAALVGFLRINKPEYIPLLQPLLHDPVPEVAE
jgi:HEAT repeat protein